MDHRRLVTVSTPAAIGGHAFNHECGSQSEMIWIFHPLGVIARRFRCPAQAGRIGKAVQIRRVPNAVRGMREAYATGYQPGRRFTQANPSQKTGLIA